MIFALWAVIGVIAAAVAATALGLLHEKKRREELERKHNDRLASLASELIRQQKAVEKYAEMLAEMEKDEESGERLRHGALLREMNDELEKGLRMEQEWNAGLASILGYSMKTATEGMKNE